MRTWKAHLDQVGWLAFSPDNTRLASCSRNDGHVRLWNPLSGELQTTVGLRPREKPANWHPTCLAFSPDSRWLALALTSIDTGVYIRIWDLLATPMKCAVEYTVDASIIGGLAFTATAPPTLFAADFGRVLAFPNALSPDASAETLPLILNRGPDRKSPKSSRVAVSPNGEWVASNGRTKSVVWEAAKLKAKFVRDHSKSPHNGPIAFHPAGDQLAVGHGTKVDLWSFANKDAIPVELSGHKLPVWGVSYTPDGRTVQTASSDGTVRSWDAATGQLRQTYDWGLGKLYTAAFAPDGLVGAAGTEDGSIVLWDLEG